MNIVFKCVVVFAVLQMSLCIGEHRTLRGALSLLEQAQYDTSVYDKKPDILDYTQDLMTWASGQMTPLLDNKLSKNYEMFNSLFAIITISTVVPIMLVVVVSFVTFKSIVGNIDKQKGGKGQYKKLPQSKPQQQKRSEAIDYPNNLLLCML